MRQGRAVQVYPGLTLDRAWFECLQLKCNEGLSNFASKFQRAPLRQERSNGRRVPGCTGQPPVLQLDDLRNGVRAVASPAVVRGGVRNRTCAGVHLW
jgi:hypothetical protein